MSTARNIADLLNSSGKIVTGKIADDAITPALIADDAVVTAGIADDAVTAALIADNAVTAAAIASGAVSAGLKSVQLFHTAGSHTWTKPSGINIIKAYVTGGGGGGGIDYYNGDCVGGGGGGGGTGIVILDVSSISSLPVTVAAACGSGAAGNTSTIGSPAYATGHGGHGAWNGDGNGHLSGGKGGGGGSATSSIINFAWLVRGNAGPTGDYHATKAGSPGGGSMWCGNGHSQTHYAASVIGIYGGGGAGRNSAYGGTGNPNNSGASGGGAGLVVVEEYA